MFQSTRPAPQNGTRDEHLLAVSASGDWGQIDSSTQIHMNRMRCQVQSSHIVSTCVRSMLADELCLRSICCKSSLWYVHCASSTVSCTKYRRRQATTGAQQVKNTPSIPPPNLSLRFLAVCPRGFFSCLQPDDCKPDNRFCDGFVDCVDGSDERDCGTATTWCIFTRSDCPSVVLPCRIREQRYCEATARRLRSYQRHSSRWARQRLRW